MTLCDISGVPTQFCTCVNCSKLVAVDTSEEVQRYYLEIVRGCAGMEPGRSGEWVKFEDYEVLRTALAASEQCQQWQPIETAPTGVFMVSIETVPGLAWPAYRGRVDGKLWSNAHGVLNEIDPCTHRITKATHWMPMPEGPK